MSDYTTRALANHLNTHVDVAPPWARYPTYERYTIGWRMGAGEGHMDLWRAYVDTLRTREEILTHLRRHGPAPMSWADSIGWILYADIDGDPALRDEIIALGLIATDAALDQFGASLARGDQRDPPWTWDDSPEHAARYLTRELWLHARHHHERRAPRVLVEAADLAPGWEHTLDALNTGALPPLDTTLGLASLAIACAANHVPGPWTLGMSLGDYQDSFDMDMNYVDAFRLWLMSCVDDLAQLDMLLGPEEVPEGWREWMVGQIT